MRELQVCPPSKWKPAEVVRRLEFSADGRELVAWVGFVLHVYDLRADTARVLFESDFLRHWEEDLGVPDPLLSPDRRLVVFGYQIEGDAAIHFEDASAPNGEGERFPDLPVDSIGDFGLMFTADGKELMVVRNYWNSGAAPDVARLDIAPLAAPPKRVEQRINPLSRQVYQ